MGFKGHVNNPLFETDTEGSILRFQRPQVLHPWYRTFRFNELNIYYLSIQYGNRCTLNK